MINTINWQILSHSQYDWSIGENLFRWIQENLRSDRVILEFGSGIGTRFLSDLWKVYSVEENKEWVGVYHKNYIYAPIASDWYDIDVLKRSLPEKFDLILVDGPAHGKRIGFFENIDVIDPINRGTQYIIFDDVERSEDQECYQKVLAYFEKRIQTKTSSYKNTRNTKQFAVIELIR